MLASPLIYSGQLSREDYELRLAHPSGKSELKYTYLYSSLILLYPDFKVSHKHPVAELCTVLYIRTDIIPKSAHGKVAPHS